MYFWVNQKKTYKEEFKGGYLWAPLLNKSGRTQFYWESMDQISVGDVIFNFVGGKIVSYCIAKSTSYKSPQPSDFNVNDEWEENGRMVDAEYFPLEEPLYLKDFYSSIEQFLPEKYSPVTPENGPRANQGYLYPISKEFGETLFTFSNTSPSNLFDQNENSEPDSYKIPDKTSRKGLVTSRVGQGDYRRRILKRWKNRCAVTGCDAIEILIASHIVPWRDSNNQERLDVDNGILLSPMFDALFDRHLISFDNDGNIIISKEFSKLNREKFGITGEEKISNLSPGNLKYLARHRKKLM